MFMMKIFIQNPLRNLQRKMYCNNSSFKRCTKTEDKQKKYKNNKLTTLFNVNIVTKHTIM